MLVVSPVALEASLVELVDMVVDEAGALEVLELVAEAPADVATLLDDAAAVDVLAADLGAIDVLLA
jgi:hypothetical protein